MKFDLDSITTAEYNVNIDLNNIQSYNDLINLLNDRDLIENYNYELSKEYDSVFLKIQKIR